MTQTLTQMKPVILQESQRNIFFYLQMSKSLEFEGKPVLIDLLAIK